MRLVKRTYLSMLALIPACFLPLALPLSTHANEEGYRLLVLDGYRVKWGDRRFGVGASISYAFAGEALRFEQARNCSDLAPITALLRENLSMEMLAHETAAAFRVWERAAGLSFHEVADVSTADIVLGTQNQQRGRAFANVSYASSEANEGVRVIEQGLVCLNPDYQWKIGFDGNENVYDMRYTLIHEIGHAIGLDHPGASGQVMGFRYTENFYELQPGDLHGIQLLYGSPVINIPSAKGLETQLPREQPEFSQTSNLISHSVKGITKDEEADAQSVNSVESTLDLNKGASDKSPFAP